MSAAPARSIPTNAAAAAEERIAGLRVGAADQDFFLCGGNSLLAPLPVALCQSGGCGGQTWDSPTCRQTRASTSSAVSLRSHGLAPGASAGTGGDARRAAGAVEERGAGRRSLRGGALPLVPRAPGGGRRLAPPVPSERDRLRHRPMPDEAAQSLRIDLSPWSCGMVFSEYARRRPDPLRPLLPGSGRGAGIRTWRARVGACAKKFRCSTARWTAARKVSNWSSTGGPRRARRWKSAPSPMKTRSSQRCCNTRIPCSSAACCD
ncbi:hypothetical protein ACPA9J_14410 [Pseudomonas aeruginosa]